MAISRFALHLARRLARTAKIVGIAIPAAGLALTSVTAFADSPVRVGKPWFRYLLNSIPAGGYMILKNTSDKPVALIGAKSPACKMMMLHRTVHSGGQERMVPVKKIIIRAGRTFQFSPGAYHVMCMHPTMRVGEAVPVTLHFSHLPPMTVQFRVYGATGELPRR